MAGQTGPGRIIFRGRRRGRRLRLGLEQLMAERLPALSVAVPADGAPLDPRGLFGAEIRDVWLEIGFGGGEHLAAQAAAHPDVGIIGCEPYLNGVATLLRAIEEGGQENVRILPDDVRPLLPLLPDGAFGRIFVLFPDPWPKLRHHARRIVQHETVAAFHRLLAPGGELRLATDDMPYARWMLERLTAHPGLAWTARGPRDWRDRPDDWPETRYEAKARAQGRAPVFLRFVKRAAEG